MARARWSSLSTLSWSMSVKSFLFVGRQSCLFIGHLSTVVVVDYPTAISQFGRLNHWWSCLFGQFIFFVIWLVGHLSWVAVWPYSSKSVSVSVKVVTVRRPSVVPVRWPSVDRLGHALGCVSCPLFLIHHLAVFSAVHGHRPGHHCSATIVRLIYASSLTSARVSLCSCLVLIVLFASP